MRILAAYGYRRYKRSSVRIGEARDRLRIEISAQDVTALMASTNTVLRELQIIEATKL